MPNFRDLLGHRSQTIALSIALLPTAFIDVRNLLVAGGCLLGLVMSPDWDLNRNQMGLLGRIQFTDEYAKLVPHRHKISHSVFFGTIVRFLLTFTTPYLLIGLIGGWWVPWWIVSRVFVGLCIADFAHVASDVIWTSIRRRRTAWKKRRSHK